MISSKLLLTSALWGVAQSQLSGSVGPLTSYKTKANIKICDVTDYDDNVSSDIGPALVDAWGDCADGGLVYIPPGTYDMVTCVELKDGQSVAVQLDGIIRRSDDADCSHMIMFRGCNDFEFFSGTSKGAMQGYGYKYLQNGEYGPRFFRFQDISDFSVHGFAAIDSASYYFVFDTVTNGEIYNIIARGLSGLGMTDAFDIWGTNIWVHDIEVHTRIFRSSCTLSLTLFAGYKWGRMRNSQKSGTQLPHREDLLQSERRHSHWLAAHRDRYFRYLLQPAIS